MSLKPQAERVLEYMKRHGSISQRQAIEAFSCFRLAARVAEIREAFGDSSVITETEQHHGGNHARYVWRRSGSVQAELQI